MVVVHLISTMLTTATATMRVVLTATLLHGHFGQ